MHRPNINCIFIFQFITSLYQWVVRTDFKIKKAHKKKKKKSINDSTPRLFNLIGSYFPRKTPDTLSILVITLFSNETFVLLNDITGFVPFRSIKYLSLVIIFKSLNVNIVLHLISMALFSLLNFYCLVIF